MNKYLIIVLLSIGCQNIVDDNNSILLDGGVETQTKEIEETETTEFNTDDISDTETEEVDECKGGCTNQPEDKCHETGALKQYTGEGICIDSECHYTFELIECINGCTIKEGNDICSDPCNDVVCNQSPEPFCDAWDEVNQYYTTLVTFSEEGVCEDGECTYNKEAISCNNSNACIKDEDGDYCADLQKPKGWMSDCQEDSHCNPEGAQHCYQALEDETFGKCTTECTTNNDCFQASVCCDCSKSDQFNNRNICIFPNEVDIIEQFCDCK